MARRKKSRATIPGAGGARATELRKEFKLAETAADKERIATDLKKKLNQASRAAGAEKKAAIKEEIKQIDLLIKKLKAQEKQTLKVKAAQNMPVAAVSASHFNVSYIIV